MLPSRVHTTFPFFECEFATFPWVAKCIGVLLVKGGGMDIGLRLEEIFREGDLPGWTTNVSGWSHLVLLQRCCLQLETSFAGQLLMTNFAIFSFTLVLFNLLLHAGAALSLKNKDINELKGFVHGCIPKCKNLFSMNDRVGTFLENSIGRTKN